MDEPLIPTRAHPVSAHPQADESLVGWVFRLAHLRGMSSARRLWNECGGGQFTNRPRHAVVETLAASARIPPPDLEAISYGSTGDPKHRFRGTEIPKRLFRSNISLERHVCPDCLAEAAYHRAIWDLVFVAACPIHLKTLIDRCPACHLRLRWTGCNLTRCVCWSGDLTRATAASVDANDMRGVRTALGLLGDARYAADAEHALRLPAFANLRAGAVLELMFRLGEASGGRTPAGTMRDRGRSRPQAHLAMKRGLEAGEADTGLFHDILGGVRP